MPVVLKTDKKKRPADLTDPTKHLPCPVAYVRRSLPSVACYPRTGAKLEIFLRTCKAFEKKVFEFNKGHNFRIKYASIARQSTTRINICHGIVCFADCGA